MKRNLGSVMVWLLAACLCLGVMPAQAQDQEVYVTVGYMKVPPGGGNAYGELEALWKPVHQVRVDAGMILGWYVYEVLSPSGTEAHHNYAIATVFPSFEAMENSYPEGAWETAHGDDVNMDQVFERTRNAREGVRNETWQLLDQLPETPLATPAPYITVDYMKVAQGGGAQYMELEALWKNIHKVRMGNGTMASWALYGLVFPGGSANEYNYATVNGYSEYKHLNDFDFAGLSQEADLGMSVNEVSMKTEAARDQVRTELWHLIDYVQASGQ